MFKEKISVIVPCFNEEKNIFKNLEKINAYCASNFVEYEIIAVNDGSTDDTLMKLRLFQKSNSLIIIDNKQNRGKGLAVKTGFLSADKQSAWVMFLDADLAIPVEELGKFIQVLVNGDYEMAIASRFVPGLKVLEPVLWHRKIMENVFRWLRILILGNRNIRDTQCGFKVFKKEAAETIFQLVSVERFAFDAEIIFLAGKIGFKIKELPITLQNPKESHVRIFFDPLNMVIALLGIRLNYWKGAYRWKK